MIYYVNEGFFSASECFTCAGGGCGCFYAVRPDGGLVFDGVEDDDLIWVCERCCRCWW